MGVNLWIPHIYLEDPKTSSDQGGSFNRIGEFEDNLTRLDAGL